MPGEEEKLATAAEGTPWCIADPNTGKSYLRPDKGYYSDEDDEEYHSDEDNNAKFILFHLRDPETGKLADNACASIRLNVDGDVEEISGLNDGQALEGSLVPIVEEKVKTLPGGENFLEAFADKKELIKLDHKMQNGEELTIEEYEFLYEINRPIKTLDTYNSEDERIPALKDTYGLDKFIAAVADPTELANQLIQRGKEGAVANNLNKFVAAGAEYINAIVRHCQIQSCNNYFFFATAY